ncbi:olfactory receptor 6C4-like protein [Cricetulus griseus]|nr:olfactory receptor 6C4-like protein [Cricetulus griseus]
METKNETMVLEFVLEGFHVAQHLGKVLFLVHLLVYLASVTGNTLIIAITWTHPHLQTPMYFFLRSFSFFSLNGCTTRKEKDFAFLEEGRFNQSISLLGAASCFHPLIVD